MISFDDFTKLEIKTGKILTCEKVVGADNLFKVTVDVAEEKPRQLVAGLANYYAPESLVGKGVVVLANLQPRVIRGSESQGMLLAAEDGTGKTIALLTPDKEIQAGSKVR